MKILYIKDNKNLIAQHDEIGTYFITVPFNNSNNKNSNVAKTTNTNKIKTRKVSASYKIDS